MAQIPGVLFTAFEPSGDEHAAPVIAALRQHRPDLPIWALGGPNMQEAGAQLIETTTEHPIMLLGAASQAAAHWRRLQRLKRWLKGRHLAALIPTDSPAANWSICGLIRKGHPEARILHLVAPQLWAWASWRIRKLKRLSDHVLCLLPFEPDWFEARGMPATFVGHSAWERLSRLQPDDDTLRRLPAEGFRLALLPGSRPGEIARNWPVMFDAWQRLRDRHPDLVAAIAAYKPALAEQVTDHVRAATGSLKLPDHLRIEVGQAHTLLHWADLALVTSGTATLHATSRLTPMVAVFKVNRLMAELVFRWLVKARTFTLPNLIAEMDGPRAIPELVPYFGDGQRLASVASELIGSEEARNQQVERLRQISARFDSHEYPTLAVEKIIELAAL